MTQITEEEIIQQVIFEKKQNPNLVVSERVNELLKED